MTQLTSFTSSATDISVPTLLGNCDATDDTVHPSGFDQGAEKGTKILTPSTPSIPSTSANTSTQQNSSRPKIRFPFHAPHFSYPHIPAAIVLRAIRISGLIYRDQLVQETQLSAATVNRQVSALLESGLIRERNNNDNINTVGRPRLLVELNAAGPLVLAIYIGNTASSISIYDPLVRMLGSVSITHNTTSPESLLSAIADAALKLTSRWQGHDFLRLGITLSGSLDDQGRVDHPYLGWKSVPVADILSSRIGLRATIAPHVEAMAAAELQHFRNREADDTTLYFYAHETVGTSVITGKAVRITNSVRAPLRNLPYDLLPKVSSNPPQYLGDQEKSGIEDVISDSAIVLAARKHQLPVKDIKQVIKLYTEGNAVATNILLERSSLLGAAISLVSDVLNPDRIILGGQAFTDLPQLLPHTTREIAERTYGNRKPIHLTAARQFVQQRAAGAVALDRLFHDPFAEISLLKSRS